MVDDERITPHARRGSLACTMGVQSGSERIRRECYERETTDDEIVAACEIMERQRHRAEPRLHRRQPVRGRKDRLATLDLFLRLPKPFYFNYFSLT